VYASKTYAKIIISELNIPNEEKTIKPAFVGGIAGGEKFKVQGLSLNYTCSSLISFLFSSILFKFALDTENLYGGDEYAMKASGHELKGFRIFCCFSFSLILLLGLMNYMNTGIRELNFPLMCLIDYRGYRITCISFLPIVGDSTLIYGSSDGGRTVHTSDEKFNECSDVYLFFYSYGS